MFTERSPRCSRWIVSRSSGFSMVRSGGGRGRFGWEHQSAGGGGRGVLPPGTVVGAPPGGVRGGGGAGRHRDRPAVGRPPDIGLLDMLLPGMHGMEVCRRMRAMAHVPIVMVSAVDTELDVVLGLELGAAGYVTKPFRLRELVARMQAILRRLSPPGGPAGDAAPPAVPAEP